ncbi:sigma-54-dependent transcriptional regulator, partial [Duncaniella muris]
MNKILIVDASVSDSRVMSNLLMKAGYDPVCVESFESGKTEAAKLPPGAVIVTAMRLNDGTATDFIDWLKLHGINHPAIGIIDGYNATQIHEILRGHRAIDIIQYKALDKTLVETVQKYAAENTLTTPENPIFPRQSEEYRLILEKVRKIARTNLNILIVGENGVGKEPLAEEIYRQSDRKYKPCAIIDALVLQHQYFDAASIYEDLKLMLRKSIGGTLIIDHFHFISPDILNIISEILKTEKYDIRFISIADKKLHTNSEIVKFGSFLHYKLSQYVITLPPLRDTRDDIIPLAEFFLDLYSEELKLEITGFDNPSKKKLLVYDWPGNIRELKNAVRIAAIEATQDVITAKDLDFDNPG